MQKAGWMYMVVSPYGKFQPEFMARFIKANEAFRPKIIIGPGGIQDVSTDRRCWVGEATAETKRRAIALAVYKALESLAYSQMESPR